MLGEYRLDRTLGAGGMASVFVGRHLESGAERAIKVLRLAGSNVEQRRERFAREARALARVDTHPGVVRIHSYELLEGDQAYCAMELVEGSDLRRVLDTEGALPLARVLRIGAGVARALVHVHAHGIVHRDVKPANILLRADGDRPMLTDFGIARDESEERMTQEEVLLGTPLYMAPEQAVGDQARVGPCTDVHALGAVLYEMLSGLSPFEGSDGMPLELIRAIAQERPPPVGSARPEGLEPLPADVDMIVSAALEKEGEARPSALAFAEALEAIARGEPVSPLPGSGLLERLFRRGARRRKLLGITAVSLLLLLASVALVKFGVRRTRALQAWEQAALASLTDAQRATRKLSGEVYPLRLGEERVVDVAPVRSALAALDDLRQDPKAEAAEPEMIRRLEAARQAAEDQLAQAALLEALAAGDPSTAHSHLERVLSEPLRSLLEASLLRAKAGADPAPALAELSRLARSLGRTHPEASTEVSLVQIALALDRGKVGLARSRIDQLGEQTGALEDARRRLAGRLLLQGALEAVVRLDPQATYQALLDAQTRWRNPLLVRRGVAEVASALVQSWRQGGSPAKTAAVLAPLTARFEGVDWPEGSTELLLAGARQEDDANRILESAALLEGVVRIAPSRDLPQDLAAAPSEWGLRLLQRGQEERGLRLLLVGCRVRGDFPFNKRILVSLGQTDAVDEYIRENPRDWAAHVLQARIVLALEDTSQGPSRNRVADCRRALAAIERARELGKALPLQARNSLSFLRTYVLHKISAPRFLEELEALERAGHPDAWHLCLYAADLIENQEPERAYRYAWKHLEGLQRRIREMAERRLPTGARELVNPEDALTRAYETLVPLLLHTGRAEQAARLLEEAERGVERVVFLRLRGKLREVQGRWREALADYEASLDYDPESSSTLKARRRLRARLADEEE